MQVDLNNKSQWHLDVNGGMIPVMENPAGDLIPESGVIMAFASEHSSKGIDIIPKDPFVAAKMRAAMCKSDPLFSMFWPMYLTRFEDPEKS